MIVTLSNITFSYEKEPIIQNLSLKIPAGFSLLMGPTGCGKSTLLKIIAGLYPKYAGKLTGTVELNGQKTAMMFQNAAEQFTMATPREEIVFALENLQVEQKDYEKRLAKAIEFTQISDLLDQKINTMSGGQQQRVSIARALAIEPQLLLFDEPTSALDPELVGEVLNTIKSLAQQGYTMIIVTHEIPFTREVTDRVVFMADGVVVEEGIPAEVMLQPKTTRFRAFLTRYLDNN